MRKPLVALLALLFYVSTAHAQMLLLLGAGASSGMPSWVPSRVAGASMYTSAVHSNGDGTNCSVFVAGRTTQRCQDTITRSATAIGGTTLTEQSSSNIALQSTNFANSVWATFAGASKVGVAGVASPDGTFNAYEISPGTTGGALNVASAVFQSLTLPLNTTYTASIYVRAKAGTTTLRLSISDGTAAIGGTADTTVTNSAWTRLQVTFTTSNGGSPGGNVAIRTNAAGNSTNVYVWGAQVELGSTATSFIPTSTAAVDRVQRVYEEQSTNSIRNSTMVGAGVGVAPTNWSLSTLSGVTATAGAPITSGGIVWLPVTLSGTASANNGTANLVNLEGVQSIAASSGQNWTMSAQMYGTGTLPTVALDLDERTSAGGPSTDHSGSSVTLTSTPVQSSVSAALSGGGATAYVAPRIYFNLVSGTTYTGTIYIARPQAENLSYATSFIPTSGTAATRGGWQGLRTPYLQEVQSVNYVRNSVGVGQAAGVVATNWSTATINGVSVTAGAPVSTNGVTYMPFTFSGTASASSSSANIIQFEANQIIPVAQGQTWTLSASMYSSGTVPQVAIDQAGRLSGGGANEDFFGSFQTLGTTGTLYSSAATWASASTGYVIPRLYFNLVNATAYSGTIYIALPQEEQKGAATSAIPTYGNFGFRPGTDSSFAATQGLGITTEETRTETLHNTVGVGSIIGASDPNLWTGGMGTTGANSLINMTGVENGMPFVDFRVQGTTTAQGAGALTFDNSNAVAALTGQTWTSAFYATLAPYSGTLPTGLVCQNAIREYTSGNAFVTQNVSAITLAKGALSGGRRTYTAALSGGVTTAFAVNALRCDWSSITVGTVVDFTIRIGLPSFQQASFATTPILTSGAAATRNADLLAYNNAAQWLSQGQGTFGFAGILGALPSGTALAFSLDDGTANNAMWLFAGNTTGVLNVGPRNGGVTGAGIGTSNVLTSFTRGAAAYGTLDLGLAGNGVAVARGGSGLTVPALSAAHLGADGSGGRAFNGMFGETYFIPANDNNAALQTLTGTGQ